MVRKKTGTGTARKKMVIIMPFTRKKTRPQLVNGKIASVKINPFNMPAPSLSMACVIEHPHKNHPKHGSAKQRTREGVPRQKECDPIPANPINKA
ncbi:MAG: hypothetical protein ABIR19_04500 [Ginsengibacter sp.]